jgi:hypothetical protein
LVYIQPKLDEEGEIVGYIAGRKVAYPEVYKEIEAKYQELHDDAYIDDSFFVSNYGDLIDKRA